MDWLGDVRDSSVVDKLHSTGILEDNKYWEAVMSHPTGIIQKFMEYIESFKFDFSSVIYKHMMEETKMVYPLGLYGIVGKFNVEPLLQLLTGASENWPHSFDSDKIKSFVNHHESNGVLSPKQVTYLMKVVS